MVSLLPPEILDWTWTASGTSGTVFTPSGSGSVSEAVTIPAGGQIVYTLTATPDPNFVGDIVTDARVAALAGQVDVDPGNNQAQDITEAADVNLVPLDDVIAGQPTTLSANGQTNAASLLVFYASPQLGSYPVPGTNLTLGLADPIRIGVGFLCDANTIEAIWHVPADAAGQTWYTQVVETDPNPQVSNVMSVTVGSGGSGGSGNLHEEGATVSGHRLEVYGTEDSDEILVTVDAAAVDVTVNGVTQSYDRTEQPIHFVSVTARGGDDRIVVLGQAADEDHGVLVVGGDGNDEIRTAGLNAEVRGEAGSDRIGVSLLQGQRAIVDAGAGDDIVTIDGAGRSTVNAGAGDDWIQGGDGHDIVDAGAGDDRVDAGAGNDVVTGADGDDTLLGQRGRDILVGGSGSDQLFGGYGRDVVLAGEGADQLSGGRGRDLLVAHGTEFDQDVDRLRMMRRQWNTGDAALADRMENLTNPNRGLLRSAVHSPSDEADTLSGGADSDVFFANLAADWLTDTETLDQLFGL